MKKEKLLHPAAALLLVCAFAATSAAQARGTKRTGKAATSKKTTPTPTPEPAKANARETAAAAETTSDEKAPAKANARAAEPAPSPSAKTSAPADGVRYAYEFSQPGSFLQSVRIEHDSAGRGRVTFERQVDTEELTDPFEFSPAAFRRVKAHWDALRFLEAEGSYQSEKQFPHMGTTRLKMADGRRQRVTEFNWTHDEHAAALAKEYRNAAEQALLVFELGVALENQPLELPKLLGRFERLVELGSLSDPQQLVPVLRELGEDERAPLVARNHAGRLLKKLQK
ncbi:MAG TPA: hypothetical protein VGV38_19375 [Pyrinomonadaceae bacterium]|nr:hypothetical protein [Pyrinomonadaceae bacterium]